MLRYILAFATLYLNWCLRKQAVLIRKSYSIELNSHVSQPINLQQWSCCSQNDIYYPSIIGLASFLLCGQHIRLRNNLCCHILSFNPLTPANGHWLWKNAAHCIQMANSLICCSQILTGDSLVPHQVFAHSVLPALMSFCSEICRRAETKKARALHNDTQLLTRNKCTSCSFTR